MLAAMQLLPGLGLNYLSGCNGGSGVSGMKSNHHFREQLSVVSGWFEQWNQCEQTVGLYSLLKRLGPVHARFLALVLEQNIAECIELQLQERHANDPGFIGSLSGESKETAVGQLLLHLPLLRPGNAEAKAQYLQLIPKVLAHSIRHGVHIEESRQLLSYSLIHPAVAPEDRAGLARWLRQLEERIALPPTPPPAADLFGLWQHHRPGGSLPPGMALQPPLSSHPDGTQTLPMPHSRLRRSTSLTPPGTMPPSCSPSSSCGTLEQEVTNGHHHHAPLSPQSSIASSGSGSEGHDKDAFSQDGTGMKDVPCWLKGLRLHKYAYIFKNMSYEEMMSITEEKLEQMNITKGARHKIVLSILKLCERQSNLRSLEKDLSEGEGTIRSALNELKAMLQTPIKAFSCLNVDSLPPPSNGEAESSGSDPPSPPATDADGPAVPEGDLPGQFTRLLGKICASLLISNQEEDLNFFVMIVDKCLSHEAFTPVQKRRLFSWKQQVQKTCHPLPARRSIDTRQRNKWNGYHSGDADAVVGGGSLRRRTPVQFQQPPPQRIALQRQGYIPNPRSSAVIKRPSLQDHMKPHVLIQRTNSAPVRPNPLPASIFGKVSDGYDSTDPELNIRLESLCLSVTEHALGSFEGAVPLF